MTLICRGSYAIGTACGSCPRCEQELADPNCRIRLWLPRTGFVGLIIERPTNITYFTEVPLGDFGAEAPGYEKAEGFLMPLPRLNWVLIRSIIKRNASGWNSVAEGVPLRSRLLPVEINAINQALADDCLDHEKVNVQLDLDRLPWGESWVPVTTRFGRGWLVWPCQVNF